MAKEIRNLAKALEGQDIKGLTTSYEPKINDLGSAVWFGIIGIKLLKSWMDYAYPYEGKKGNLRSSNISEAEHEKNIQIGFERRIKQNAPKFMEELANLDPEELAKLSGISTQTVDEIMKGVVNLCKLHQEKIRKPLENCNTRYANAVKQRENKKRGQDL